MVDGLWVYCIAEPELARNVNGYLYRMWYRPVTIAGGEVNLSNRNCRVEFSG